MKSLSIAGGMILLSLCPLVVPAQEVGYIDLTDNVFRASSRPVRGFGVGCSSSSKSQPEVTVTLVSLDKSRYRIGEEVTFEIKVLNSGQKTIAIPWTPHLGDLEPADAKASYKYRVGMISLLFRDPEGLELAIFENLYGSIHDPASLRELLPGRWFTVKGRKRIELQMEDWGKKQFGNSGFVATKASAFYAQNRGMYSPKAGGSTNERCVPLSCRKANQLDITIDQPSL